MLLSVKKKTAIRNCGSLAEAALRASPENSKENTACLRLTAVF